MCQADQATERDLIPLHAPNTPVPRRRPPDTDSGEHSCAPRGLTRPETGASVYPDARSEDRSAAPIQNRTNAQARSRKAAMSNQADDFGCETDHAPYRPRRSQLHLKVRRLLTPP